MEDLFVVAIKILKELSEGRTPKAGDFGITIDQFGGIIEDLKNKNFIRGANLARGGRDNRVMVVFLKGASVTLDGLEYLRKNSDAVMG